MNLAFKIYLLHYIVLVGHNIWFISSVMRNRQRWAKTSKNVSADTIG